MVCYISEGLCVPNVPEFKAIILEEADLNRYTVHPSSTKMYQNLKVEVLVERHKEKNSQFKTEHQKLR